MPTFKDVNGQEWLLRLDVGKIRDVRELHHVNLATLDGTAYDRLESDPELLVNVLWTLCKSQAPEKNINEQQFGEALVGDAIDHATAALLEAIAGFFPKSKREMVQTLAKRTQAIREVGLQKALAKINDPELEAKLTAAMDRKLEADINEILTQFDSATSSPASSESSPTD
jgi:chorismate mutase